MAVPALPPFLEQLFANVRFADVLDVLFIALLLYFGLAWFRQRATRSILIGLAAILSVYVIARGLDMYLTTRLFQGGFVVLVIVLVIIFQQDLRRGFERLASVGLFHSDRPTRPEDEVVETVVQSAALLAENRTGALIVFEGREPLDHHVRGGVALDGEVSQPLLHSIFNPESAGHDGAVVIRGTRIETFATHLPLSKNLEAVGSRGTRHAAALGLTEVCDALVVVVSEERGTITVASHGQLKQVDPLELSAAITRHLDEVEPGLERERWYNSFLYQWTLKLLALAVALSLWMMIAYRIESLQRTYVVPVEYRNLPANWVVDDPQPASVTVTLSGSERAFDLLDANSFRVSFDLAHIRAEGLYDFPTRAGLVKLPAELSVSEVVPGEIRVRVRKKTAPPPATETRPKPAENR